MSMDSRSNSWISSSLNFAYCKIRVKSAVRGNGADGGEPEVRPLEEIGCQVLVDKFGFSNSRTVCKTSDAVDVDPPLFVPHRAARDVTLRIKKRNESLRRPLQTKTSVGEVFPKKRRLPECRGHWSGIDSLLKVV